MENSSKTVCRLCCQVCDNNFEFIEEITIDRLMSLQLDINLAVSDDPVICENCSKILKTCHVFKVMCMKTEDRLSTFMRNEKKIVVDLREFCLNNEHIQHGTSDGYNVCRFCLEVAKCVISLKNVAVIERVERHFPELDIGMTSDPVMCIKCYESLQSCFCFTSSCSATERRINEYCKMNGKNDKGQVDLNDVFNYVPVSGLKTTKADCNLNGFKVEGKCCEFDLKVEVKTENPMQSDEQECRVKEECVNVKTEQSDRESSLNILSPLQPSKYREALTCPLCPYRTVRKHDFNRHIATHKDVSEITTYRCNICPYQAKLKSNLRRHELTHKNPKEITMYHCETCTYQTKRKDCLQQHLLSHRTGLEEILYMCEVCGYQTSRRDYLRKHQQAHTGTSNMATVKCELCEYQTKRKDNLKTHLLTHKSESELTIYKCEICGLKTKHKSSLRLHILKHNSSIKSTLYKCEMCKYETKSTYYLQRHLVKHDTSLETTHKCEECPYETTQKRYLQKHMLTHRDDAELVTFSCEDCEYSTKRRNNFRRHLLTHKTIAEVTAYQCSKCTYRTKNKYYLRLHMLTHKNKSEAMVFKCDKCSFKSKYKHNLNRHLETHK